MKQLIIIVLVLQASFTFAQQEKKYIKKGNDLYQQQNYKDAESSYRQSVGKKAQTVEGNFNLGDALYKQKKFDEAGKQFTKIASSANNKQVLAKAYHNLGNSLMDSKKLEESVAAYKKSLLNNPQDEETRYNLAYAQKKLEQKQQQDKKNNKNDKNKDKNKKDQDKKNQDKNKDQDKKDQNKKDQDKKDQDKKDQEQPKPDPNNVSKEDAERMLEALGNDEKQTQDKLKNQKLKGARRRVTQEW
jgi:Ca-activated chloride channel family protein